MITAICNIYIGTEQKFEIFKETFPEVFDISDNWLIYIRGKYKKEVLEFIQNICINKLNNITLFDNLYDDNWVKSIQEMLKKSKYDYVYLYWEDHFLVKELDYFKNVISDIKESNIDYLQYSMYKIGLSIETIDILFPDDFNNIKIIDFNKNNIDFIKKEYGTKFYPYSLISISKKKIFINILKSESVRSFTINKYVQYIFSLIITYPKNRIILYNINKLLIKFGFQLKLFPLNTPFNLEKSIFDFDIHMLPLKIGISKEEIFGNWDDDNGFSRSSLIKRGLYPKKMKSKNTFLIQTDLLNKVYLINKGKKEKFTYFSEMARTPVPIKYIKVLDGKIKISSLLEEYILDKGQDIFIHPNIVHFIEGIDDSKYIYIINNFLEKNSYFNMK